MVVIDGALQALPESGCPGKAQLHSTCCKLRTQLDQLIKLIKCHTDLTVSGPGLAVGLIKYSVGEGLRTNTCHVVHGQARRSDVAIGIDDRNRRRSMDFKHGQVNSRPTSRPRPKPRPRLRTISNPIPNPSLSCDATSKRTSDRPQSVGTLGLPFCRADIRNVCPGSQICMLATTELRTRHELKYTVQKIGSSLLITNWLTGNFDYQISSLTM